MQNFSILYMGMPTGGELSRLPLLALLEAGFNLCAVVMPGAKSEPDPIHLDPPDIDPAELDFVPMVSKHLAPSVITVAWEHKIPLIAIGSLKRPAAYEALAALQPDLICVSCFSRIIPPAILSLPKRGAINLHPALLPRYRGPWPLFWQFKHGEGHTGVTMHYMAKQVDAGDIILQSEVPFEDGISATEADRLCGEAGGRIMVEAANLIRAGTPPRRPQNEAQASYYPLPTRADLTVHTAQPARRAFNFIRGVRQMVGEAPLEILVGETKFRTQEAVEYSAEAALGEPYRREGDEVLIQFEPGVLRIKV
ncbi:MAG TPA: formyltransferase family protein [Anaerolineales bacterium]|nr:formyltransferase family protein [Anaerolineales bacterium]